MGLHGKTGIGTVAEDARNVQETVKGNDIDSDGDGRVDAADHATASDYADSAGNADNADNLGGNPPSYYSGSAAYYEGVFPGLFG